MFAELRSLSSIIQSSLDSIESVLHSRRLDFPSLHTPVSAESEAVRMLPEIASACSLIISAADQLIHATRAPTLSLTTHSMAYGLSAALGVTAAAHIAEACREAGPRGAHVNDLARASNMNPKKLARILRILATNHIFVEVSPDVFAINRISSAMDTGKTIKVILDSPADKYIGTSCVGIAMEQSADDDMKAMACLTETLLDSKFAMSDEPSETALNTAFHTDRNFFEWLEAKGNEHRLRRFGMTMEGFKQITPPNAIVEGFEWAELNEGAIVVEVGSGLGGQSMILARRFSHLNFVLQDRERVVSDAIEFWKERIPAAVESGRVDFQVHDFYAEQPVKGATIYLLRAIIHDWSDKYCLRILRRLREAAAPTSRLVVVDTILPYACAEDGVSSIPGAEKPRLPAPLLPNGGHANIIPYMMDLQMMSLLNGQERTLTQFRELLEQGGWRLVRVHQGVGFGTPKLIGAPM